MLIAKVFIFIQQTCHAAATGTDDDKPKDDGSKTGDDDNSEDLLSCLGDKVEEELGSKVTKDLKEVVEELGKTLQKGDDGS